MSGGFDYSEIHESYFRMKHEKHHRQEKPAIYKSEITGSEYSFEDYSNIGGESKFGFRDLPKNEYPFKIIYISC